MLRKTPARPAVGRRGRARSTGFGWVSNQVLFSSGQSMGRWYWYTHLPRESLGCRRWAQWVSWPVGPLPFPQLHSIALIRGSPSQRDRNRHTVGVWRANGRPRKHVALAGRPAESPATHGHRLGSPAGWRPALLQAMTRREEAQAAALATSRSFGGRPETLHRLQLPLTAAKQVPAVRHPGRPGAKPRNVGEVDPSTTDRYKAAGLRRTEAQQKRRRRRSHTIAPTASFPSTEDSL